MIDSSYNGGGTPGGKWGCALAVIITLPIFIMLLIVEALGDCAPDVSCGKGFWSHVVLPSALVALVVGFSVRSVVNRFFKRK